MEVVCNSLENGDLNEVEIPPAMLALVVTVVGLPIFLMLGLFVANVLTI